MHTAKKVDVFFILWDTIINFNQRRGDMKKVFVVLLLLVSVFLIGNSKVALAVADDGGCQLYQCTGKYSCGEGIEEWEECVELCLYGDGFAEIGGLGWGCGIGGRSLFSSNKNFVGLGGSSWSQYLGCSVDLRGNSMTVDLYDESNCMVQLRCVKSESCQSPS